MKPVAYKIFTISIILLILLSICDCATTKQQERSLTENYTDLANDVKWFFRGVSKFADTVEQLLPNVTTDMMNTRSFSENSRLTFLKGLRHLLVGVREIAIMFEQNFNTDHIIQVHQLKHITDFVNDLVTAIKMWFTQIRALAGHLLQLYNRYIPEVLFGKCLGNYLIATHPERSYYEYPFILFMEIYTSITTTITTSNNSQMEPTTESASLYTDLNMQQNEISHSDLNDYEKSYSTGSTSLSPVTSTATPLNSENIFDFSEILRRNKDEIIESAGSQPSWQLCFKFYTAESISRSLKIYFLGL